MNSERKVLLQSQITEAMENEDFCRKLFQCEDSIRFSQVLSTYDIYATPEEINELLEAGQAALNQMKDSESQEFSDEQLESVAGGSRFWRGVASVTGGAALGFGLGVVCGVCPAFTPAAYKIAVGYSAVAAVWTANG